MKANVKRSTVVAAFIVAICADGIEIGLAPLFFEGFLSPFNDVLDVVVGGILVALLGWHIAFLPTFVVKLITEIDLAPTWTIAVLIATRGGRIAAKPGEPPVIRPDPNVVDVEAEVKPEPPKL